MAMIGGMSFFLALKNNLQQQSKTSVRKLALHEQSPAERSSEAEGGLHQTAELIEALTLGG